MLELRPSFSTRVEPRDLPIALPLRVILALVALLAISAPILIVANAPRVVPVKRAAIQRPPVRVIPKAELPPVEPTAFVAVDAADARAFNATIPFSTAPNLPARAFNVMGSPDSVARAVDCLTAGVLYESGDDQVGQKAVAQVILNRVRHPAFPKTVCGVVFQGSERRTGCQFTFTCDGALTRRYSDVAWGRARDIAIAALNGSVERKVGTATHYHTDWVVPYWSSSLDKISEVNTHLFFRWTGWWGTPPAFRGRYAGVEPLVPKLARIAAAHLGADAEALLAEGEIGTLDAAAVPPAELPQPMVTDPNSFLITLDPRMAPAEFGAYALRICGERPYCKLLAWTERADTPAVLPADPQTMGRLAFSYLRDRGRGFDKALWNCERYERPDLAQCMKQRVFLPSTRRTDDFKLEMLPGSGLRSALGLAPREGEVEPLGGVRRKSGTLAPVGAAPAVAPPPVKRTIGPEVPK